MRAIVCTGNVHKVEELQQLLPQLALEPLPRTVELPPEVGMTFEDNARIKARAGAEWLASQGIEAWAIADDSGLEVDALAGAPGVRSARFAGDGATDAENNRLLLERLADVAPELRSARFRCVLVAVSPSGHHELVAAGSVEGHVATDQSGSAGFGYDPLFVPAGERHSFAELGAEAKARMSHRADAAQRLARMLDRDEGLSP